MDRVEIRVSAGRGGDGLVAFRREAFVPRGGPSGGDGGRGGDVILRASRSLSTLLDFRSGREFRAGDGRPGGPSRRTGAGGRDLELVVPEGTIVTDMASGEVLGDLREDGQRLVVASGGSPGRGNAAFAGPRRQAPRFATRGRPGQQRHLLLDLKLMADCGLVGMPNAGKSTLLAAVSNARPKIGSYPFTTINPSLGVVRMGCDLDFVIADLPGLIEGASGGAGLGLRFLRHAERTALLVFVLAPDLELAPGEQLAVLRAEMAAYGGMDREQELVVVSKMDLLTPGRPPDKLEGVPAGALFLSAATGEGVREFLEVLSSMVARQRLSGLPSQPRDGAGSEGRASAP